MTRSWCTVLVLSLACGHSDPFGPYPSESGLLPDSGGRLTYSSRNDALGGHSARGDEVFYTYCEDSKAELHTPCGEQGAGGGNPNTSGDRCLGALPARGGGRLVSLCGTANADADSIKQFLAGTRLEDGSLVYVYLTRRATASFSVNPALYVLRPGAPEPVRVFQFTPRPLDSGVPRRLIPAGPGTVLTLGGEVPQLITLGPGTMVGVRDVPGAVAADPRRGQLARSVGNGLVLEDLGTGAQTPIAVPETGWALSATVSVSVADGVVALTQRELDPVSMAPTGLVRVMLLREGSEPTLVALDRGVNWGAVSLSPDARSLVIERDGDLYLIEVAP